ncbi:hypothetical protein DL98DRAFT_595945 [Cadophora sp. DSE1049]|nr:hypothetical protein DL98DRAFT_595945 [Cadophora sp. DSE1049]
MVGTTPSASTLDAVGGSVSQPDHIQSASASDVEVTSTAIQGHSSISSSMFTEEDSSVLHNFTLAPLTQMSVDLIPETHQSRFSSTSASITSPESLRFLRRSVSVNTSPMSASKGAANLASTALPRPLTSASSLGNIIPGPHATTSVSDALKIGSSQRDTGKDPSLYDLRLSKIIQFTLLLKLPYMLRHKVWKESIEVRRAVDVVYDKAQNRYFSFNTKVPSILQACQESRFIVLDHYTPLFGTSSNPALIYVDLQTDTLVFDDWLAGVFSALIGPLGGDGSSLAPIEIDVDFPELHIQHIAILFQFSKTYTKTQLYHGLCYLLKRFPVLRRLVFTLEARSPDEREEIRLLRCNDDMWCCHSCETAVCGPPHKAISLWKRSQDSGMSITPSLSLAKVARGVASWKFSGFSTQCGRNWDTKIRRSGVLEGDVIILKDVPNAEEARGPDLDTADTRTNRGDSGGSGRENDSFLPEHEIDKGELEGLLADNRPYDMLPGNTPRIPVVNGIFQVFSDFDSNVRFTRLQTEWDDSEYSTD